MIHDEGDGHASSPLARPLLVSHMHFEDPA